MASKKSPGDPPHGAPQVVEVIHTRLEKRGIGVAGDAVRRVDQYYTLDGELLWEDDPMGVDIELALADIKALHRDGEGEIDGVSVELLEGAEEYIEGENRD